ncbi:TetR/AcrR family transcriptional regulator [Rhodococcus sp. NCIMB 12038]|uniref:TetR/AcrR family transcriptional regulator n=1 Tax=Rhodococcus sp. NCIMB 12038 TaxID=933800 RepID=UPI000B3CEE12|nr:TetR/AcrR family transcriptional regulator [Rhodococcus sp. NCIMB 12038]OUS92012.1 TetR family transcriptional regulator [Rhodococcus sp. NCIMB 12038]
MDTEQADWLTGGSRRVLAVERIHAAAADLMREHGIDGVSVDEVAARAGCSRATLYRYAGGKRTLVAAVMSRAADAVADHVERALEPFADSERIVEAILASLVAIRAEPALVRWFTGAHPRSTDEYLARAPELGRVAISLTRIAPDEEAAGWIVRVVLALLTWPLPDAAAERRTIERFVEPIFRIRASS